MNDFNFVEHGANEQARISRIDLTVIVSGMRMVIAYFTTCYFFRPLELNTITLKWNCEWKKRRKFENEKRTILLVSTMSKWSLAKELKWKHGNHITFGMKTIQLKKQWCQNQHSTKCVEVFI